MSHKHLMSILLLMMIPLGTRANASDIFFKLLAPSGKPVAGRIDIAKPDSQGKQEAALNWVTVLTLPDGEGRYKIARCAPPGILFRAVSYDLTLFLTLPEMMKSCLLGEIDFHFTRKRYAIELTKALSPYSPIIADSPRAKTLQAAVISALKVGDYPAAATNSMLLNDKIRIQFGAKAADPFRILATDVAASAITNSQPLVFDLTQKKYVMGPKTVKAVADFQDRVGLKATGTLNWPTAVKLPDLRGDLNASRSPS